MSFLRYCFLLRVGYCTNYSWILEIAVQTCLVQAFPGRLSELQHRWTKIQDYKFQKTNFQTTNWAGSKSNWTWTTTFIQSQVNYISNPLDIIEVWSHNKVPKIWQKSCQQWTKMTWIHINIFFKFFADLPQKLFKHSLPFVVFVSALVLLLQAGLE